MKMLKIPKLNIEIKTHESNYWHIKKFSVGMLLLFLLFTALAVFNFGLVIKEFPTECLSDEYCKFSDLGYAWILIGEYILVSLSVITIVAMIKGGFDKLKNYKEDGLIGCLIGCLIAGLIGYLIGCLIAGLIGYLIVFLIAGLIGYLIGCLIVGLIASLIVILIASLIFGLSEEFS